MANELRQLVDTANAPIFGIDVHGNVNEWNDKTAEITGFSKEEAFNKPLVSTFIMPKLRRSIQEVMDSALRGNETSNYELEFCTKSDEIRYLLVNATTRRDEDSNIVGVVGVAQDGEFSLDILLIWSCDLPRNLVPDGLDFIIRFYWVMSSGFSLRLNSRPLLLLFVFSLYHNSPMQ